MAGRHRVDVLFLPDYSASNPYQRELSAALGARGLSVADARAPRRNPLGILTAWLSHGRPRILHLHWTHNYLGQHASRPNGRITRPRAWVFLGQLVALRAVRVRVVWTVHNLGHHEGRENDPMDAWVHRSLVRIASVVICHCDAAVEAVITEFGLSSRDRPKLHVIPHGNYVDAYGLPVERGAARATLGLSPDARVLLFIGAVRAYKGVSDLVSAFRDAPDPNLRLVIAGRPATPEDAAGIAAAAAADSRIDLRLRFIPDAELPALLGAADVVALPFRDILTSGSAILAMSYGRAVVAPGLGCLPETLDRDGAVLYDPNRPHALADALARALASDLDAMGRHNLAVARQLAWGPIAAATLALYRPS